MCKFLNLCVCVEGRGLEGREEGFILKTNLEQPKTALPRLSGVCRAYKNLGEINKKFIVIEVTLGNISYVHLRDM